MRVISSSRYLAVYWVIILPVATLYSPSFLSLQKYFTGSPAHMDLKLLLRDFCSFSTHRNPIEKSLVSQVNVAFTAFKAGILTAFCQPLFAYLAVCENSKRNFDEPS